MAATYEPIASQTLETSVASITFSSIPSTYTDLVLIGYTRGTTADGYANNVYGRVQVNGDTGSNYSTTTLGTSNPSGTWTFYSGRTTNGSRLAAWPIPNSTHASGIFGPLKLQIMSYANENVYKTALLQSGYASNLTNYDGPRIEVGMWRSISTITSITIFLSAGNLESGSSFSLYGIKSV